MTVINKKSILLEPFDQTTFDPTIIVNCAIQRYFFNDFLATVMKFTHNDQ